MSCWTLLRRSNDNANSCTRRLLLSELRHRLHRVDLPLPSEVLLPKHWPNRLQRQPLRQRTLLSCRQHQRHPGGLSSWNLQRQTRPSRPSRLLAVSSRLAVRPWLLHWWLRNECLPDRPLLPRRDHNRSFFFVRRAADPQPRLHPPRSEPEAASDSLPTRLPCGLHQVQVAGRLRALSAWDVLHHRLVQDNLSEGALLPRVD